MRKQVFPRKIKPILQDEITVDWKDRLVKFSGLNPGLLLIVLVVLYFSGEFLLRLIDTPTAATLEKVVTSISTEHKTLHEEHQALLKSSERIADATEVNTFLNTKTESEKKRYHLDEPRALRRMQGND